MELFSEGQARAMRRDMISRCRFCRAAGPFSPSTQKSKAIDFDFSIPRDLNPVNRTRTQMTSRIQKGSGLLADVTKTLFF
jgi:hypothetical protein